jgi:uncharacterized HAD superfamily protein
VHIGVDLDNTVLDATSSYLQYYNKASGLSLTPDDVNDYCFYRLYGWDNEQHKTVYHKYGFDIHWNSKPFPMAVEILQQLFDKHQISIITARPLLFHEVTVEWLKHHNIRYHNITLTENKLQECINSNVDVLIDDAPHYAKEFALQNKPIILFEQPYNSPIANDLVYRASNWLEVKKQIDYLESLFHN